MTTEQTDQGRDKILKDFLLSLKVSQKAIGDVSMCRIRSDWTKAVKSVNKAQPLAQAARWSALRRDYRRLAAQIEKNTANGN